MCGTKRKRTSHICWIIQHSTGTASLPSQISSCTSSPPSAKNSSTKKTRQSCTGKSHYSARQPSPFEACMSEPPSEGNFSTKRIKQSCTTRNQSDSQPSPPDASSKLPDKKNTSLLKIQQSCTRHSHVLLVSHCPSRNAHQVKHVARNDFLNQKDRTLMHKAKPSMYIEATASCSLHVNLKCVAIFSHHAARCPLSC